MASISSLQYENGKLGDLKTNLRTIADRLYNSNNDAAKIARILDRNYTLNNNSVAGVAKVNDLRNDILDLRSRILDVYIPAIDNQISSNEAEIREIRRREEEERRRREEEERKRREEMEDKLRRQSMR